MGVTNYIGKIQIDSTTDALIASTMYGISTTSANVATKKVTSTENNSGKFINNKFDTPLQGTTIHVKFTQGNTVDSGITLQVGTTSAYDVVGSCVCGANTIVSFTLDENNKWVVNDVNTDTKYSFATGTTSGTFTVSVNGGAASPISIAGLGDAAWTSASDYATSSHNHDTVYAPINNPTFTGTVLLPSIDTSSGDNVAATKLYVDTKINAGLGAADAMVFKGTLGTGGTISALPTGNANTTPSQAYKKGWTYRIITAGTYAGEVCEVGDLLIALEDSTSGQTSANAAHWTVAQTNIDGAVITSGSTSGYIAVFNGQQSITGLATASGTSRFLKEDGTWAEPSGNRDPGYGQINISALTSSTSALTASSATSIVATTYSETFTLSTYNKWILATGSNGTSGNDIIYLAHALSSATASSYGDSSAQTPGYGETFKVPYITIDEAGHITAISEHNVTIPATDNTDEKVAQIGTTTSAEYPLLFKYSNGTTSETNSVQYGTTSGKLVTINPATGIITAAGFNGALDSSAVLTALGTSTATADATAYKFYHISGTWKTISVGTTTTTVASVDSGVLYLKSTVNDSATLSMS